MGTISTQDADVKSNFPDLAPLVLHLRENAPRYFDHFKNRKVAVELVRTWDLFSSTIYQFDIKANELCHSVVVKIPVGRKAAQRFARMDTGVSRGRLRLRPLPNPETKFELEHVALSEIHNYITQLQDPRFGSVRVLDILPEARAIVMEGVQEPKLGNLFSKANRLQRPFMSNNLEIPFANAGAWLRAYHQLPKLSHARVRCTHRADFIKSIHQLADFLTRTQGNATFFEMIASKAEAAAHTLLPDRLPLGMGHGDFAPHNIFVGPEGRVTVFDTLAAWQTPIYEDVSYFLTLVKTNKLQTYSLGLAFNPEVLGWYEKAFLHGYFGSDTVPWAVIRLFEIQVLLSKWRLPTYRHQTATWIRRMSKKSRQKIAGRFFRQRIGCLLREINMEIS